MEFQRFYTIETLESTEWEETFANHTSDKAVDTDYRENNCKIKQQNPHQ